MAGSKVTSTTADEMRDARKRGESKTDVAKVRARTPYVWDGKNEDEQPLKREEMQAGIETYRKERGRPAESDKSPPPFGSTAMFLRLFVSKASAGKRE